MGYSFVYTRQVVYDGNFSAELYKPKFPEDDVQLTNGTGFMVGKKRYHEHLKMATEIKQVSFATILGKSLMMLQKHTCHDYTAINKANLIQQHLVYTGVGGACCARNGCWVPYSMVNFQKGEVYVPPRIDHIFFADILCRQKNMDYCVLESLKYNTKGLPRAVLYYDIMCQYLVHMMSRFKNNAYLELPTSLTHITKAIGLFHIHGHKDECFAQYAPTFIPGAGIVDGEIIETLWEPLNPIAPSAGKASPEHCWEIMDDHMNHSNWKKLICISKLSILQLNLCHQLIPDLSGPSAGEIPCRSQRASEG